MQVVFSTSKILSRCSFSNIPPPNLKLLTINFRLQRLVTLEHFLLQFCKYSLFIKACQNQCCYQEGLEFKRNENLQLPFLGSVALIIVTQQPSQNRNELEFNNFCCFKDVKKAPSSAGNICQQNMAGFRKSKNRFWMTLELFCASLTNNIDQKCKIYGMTP